VLPFLLIGLIAPEASLPPAARAPVISTSLAAYAAVAMNSILALEARAGGPRPNAAEQV
jgi:hypothetical protein